MHTQYISKQRLDYLLLYQTLTVVALSLMFYPLLSPISGEQLMLLVSLVIPTSCIATLLASYLKMEVTRMSVSLLFFLWVIVWLQLTL